MRGGIHGTWWIWGRSDFLSLPRGDIPPAISRQETGLQSRSAGAEALHPYGRIEKIIRNQGTSNNRSHPQHLQLLSRQGIASQA